MTEANYRVLLEQGVSNAEVSLTDIVEGREGVVFLAPMGAHHAVAIEVWQVVAQWDVQRGDDGTVNTVRYGASEHDPEYTQPFTTLKKRVQDATTLGARVPRSSGADRIPNADGLQGYYESIGAYGFIGPYDSSAGATGGSESAGSSGPDGGSGQSGTGTGPTFTPAQPPPVYVPAPSNFTASAVEETKVELAWTQVSDAGGYHVQYRGAGTDKWWVTADKDIAGASADYTVSGLDCGKTYDFRVGGYGDGTKYNARAGLWAVATSATTSACKP